MPASETKREILAHLDKMTREATPATVASFTTTRIAADVNVSRSLASQYLNELVRDNLIVKVNTRPVIYLHKSAFERYLQVPLAASEYASMEALLRDAGVDERRDFAKAIGHDLSLSSYVEQLKAAISYPPYGLPVLLVGEPGCGKAFLSHLAFEYGKNAGVLRASSKYARVNCTLYAGAAAGVFQRTVFGTSDVPGLTASVDGGVVFLENIDALDASQREFVLSMLDTQGKKATNSTQPARFFLSASCATDNAQMAALMRAVPVVVSIPPLRERTLEERTEFIRHFLRAQGRRVSANVSISRGALRTLVSASFDDNVDGLRSCIINCCSDAYASAVGEKNELTILSYNLPAPVLGSRVAQGDDSVLVSCEHTDASDDGALRQRFLEAILSAFESFRDELISFGELLSTATAQVREYQDYLNFECPVLNPRVLSYEQVLNAVFETVGVAHDVDLTRKSVRLLAQCLGTQLWCDDVLARWKQEHAVSIQEMLALLSRHLRTTAAITEQIAGETKTALGLELDTLSRLMLMLDVNSTVSDSHSREVVGIICCHGYATATSMADAANRILRSHVFDAIDMTYDQQVTDVIRPLRRLIDRYSYCTTVVLLVDMGSLTELVSAVSSITDVDIVTINNVSTGLALEVGMAVRSGEALEPQLDAMVAACASSYNVSHRSNEVGSVVFCSESGVEAAEKIRQLFAESLPEGTPIELCVADYRELANNGLVSPVFSHGPVRAIVGTMDPGVESVPFLALENILYEGPTKDLDKVFSRALDKGGVTAFHASLLKRLTLQNVIESLTILNPEKLYAEVSAAVSRLFENADEKFAPAATLGLYVHLCCLVERLVTKTPIDAYANERDFEHAHADFISVFRESFSEISEHYRVEVPVTEIAYVFDYIRSKSATRERLQGDVGEGDQGDE